MNFDWYCFMDKQSRKVFYQNIKTNQTQWERPKDGMVKPRWYAFKSKYNKLYFKNIDNSVVINDDNKPSEFSDPQEKWFARLDVDTNMYWFARLDVHTNMYREKTWNVPACFNIKKRENEDQHSINNTRKKQRLY